MNPRVVGIAGPLKGTTFPLPGGEVSIGRESSNQLWVADPALSRHQCLLIREGEQFILRDLASRNGTLVNGVPIEQRPLHHGDQISIGNSVLVFLLEEDEVRPGTSPVELTETGGLDGSSLVLRQEDALYLQPDKVIAALPQNARLAHDLNTLLKIATAIGRIRDWESLEWQLLGMIFDVVPADSGAVLNFDDNPEDFSSAVAWNRLHGPGHPVRVSRTVVQRVLRDRVALLVCNVAADAALREVKSLVEFPVHSLLCVPLVMSGKVPALIYLDTQNPTVCFDESHLQVITAAAGIATLALENVRHWERLREENQNLCAEINLEHNMVGGSSAMREVFEFIRRAAPTDATVLIQGESGTGKELVARAIHRNSPRAGRPFVAINCAAITESLLESELFGHEKGAFTGAVGQKKGKVEMAEGGTLFLDEVSELAAGLQAKLLRVLQEREFERVGGTRPIRIDIRLIAATNKNLEEALETGAFRKDLYYRLNVVAVTMPPLRERREDIPELTDYFILKASRKCKTRSKPVSPEAQACLMAYDWPGNVRELENAIERAIVLGLTDALLPEDLPEAVLEAGIPSATPTAKYHHALTDMKRQLVLQALQQASGNYLEAAKSLGVHPNSLLRLIRRLGLKTVAKAGPPLPRLVRGG